MCIPVGVKWFALGSCSETGGRRAQAGAGEARPNLRGGVRTCRRSSYVSENAEVMLPAKSTSVNSPVSYWSSWEERWQQAWTP